MEHPQLFRDLMHVNKNMVLTIGADKSQRLSLYDKTVQALCTETDYNITYMYGPKQGAYLANIIHSEL